MKTPYVPHLFGVAALAKTINNQHKGWLTARVASSIAWPQDDIWIEYNGVEYFLQGARIENGMNIAPSISTPSDFPSMDDALSRLYRFASILGYYKQGYVDVVDWAGGGMPMKMSIRNEAALAALQGGTKKFNCNHMPIIEDENARKALAFLREGRRLRYIHQPYSFLSFFKVIESQLDPKFRIDWVENNLYLLKEEGAVKRISELRRQGININKHLYESGRCAVAHASVSGSFVDPDIPADRQRITADLDVIAALANRYIKVELGIPDYMDLYKTRDRTSPWHSLMTPSAVTALKAGDHVANIEELGGLRNATVSVRLWPDPPVKQFKAMRLIPISSGDGVVIFNAVSSRNTIILSFAMDVKNGRIHPLLEQGGRRPDAEVTEQDIEDYTRYFHSVVGNHIVEITIDGAEPVDCEVIIPVNIIPQNPEEAVARALEHFRRTKSEPSPTTSSSDP